MRNSEVLYSAGSTPVYAENGVEARVIAIGGGEGARGTEGAQAASRAPSAGVLCVFAGREEADALAAAVAVMPPASPAPLAAPPAPHAASPVTLVLLTGADWNRDFSPWRAPRCFKGGEDFGGGADAFLNLLTERVLPAVEARLASPPAWRGCAGYSLAGLFALYALYRTDAFRAAASVSGSLWFDGWTDFARSHQPLAHAPRVYLSLGDREEQTQNERLRTVGARTRETEALLRAAGAEVAFELNAGGHFTAPTERLARGVRWLAAGADASAR